MLDPYWVGGPKKYVKRTSVRYVFLLKRDPLAQAVVKADPSEAIRFLEEARVETPATPGPLLSTYRNQPFFNPHLLAKTPDRIDLQKRYFGRLFEAAECYFINTAAISEREIEQKILEIVSAP
jgi:hypothetical protein